MTTDTAQRIKARWAIAGSGRVLQPRNSSPDSSINYQALPRSRNVTTYSGSDITNTTGDFLGDWRSADSWIRFDMLRVRNRSRQLARGNPWWKSFERSLINNVLGHRGFSFDPCVFKANGDRDLPAEQKIRKVRKQFEKKGNFESRKRLSGREFDKSLLRLWAVNGEIIIRRLKRFDNEFGFTNQLIDPDYLDHNLNRVEPNGNIIKMGVELDGEFKFPVAYWFLHRRPNDYFYNYVDLPDNRYYRVPAEEITHIFIQDMDSEQTRGWPWVFAAAVNLFRLGKFEEASLVNAAISASKMGFFEKTIPDGWQPADVAEDEGQIIDHVEPGAWTELPYGVKPHAWEGKYPDAEFEPYQKAMLGGIAACLGLSRMSLTGDLKEANYSSMRAGQKEEQENWKDLQEFVIETWKEPEMKDFIYRAILTGKLTLPLSELERFDEPHFSGRRWPYVNPVDDLKAKEVELSLGLTSQSAIIREQGGDPDKVLLEIAEDKKKWGVLGIDPYSKDTQKIGKPEKVNNQESKET